MKSWTTLIIAMFVGTALALVASACHKQAETETAADEPPRRPPAPSGTMSLRGEYWRSGPMGMFRDCTTGEQWPVADEGNNQLLDEAYLASGVPLGQPLVVTVEGGIDYRPSPSGNDKQMTLIVARFVKVGPGTVCTRATNERDASFSLEEAGPRK